MRTFLIVLICTVSLSVNGQKHYFQQDVDYNIDVTLNDKSHILKGFETVKYQNNSPDTLKYLFFHLWPNAYKNDRTAFTAQMVENRDKTFYFSDDDDKGFIDSLIFKVNGELVNVSEYNNYEDVVMIELNKALLPGDSIVITTPFRVVLPKVFSRMGHDGQNYQISQWYPKPAVYDHKGWHPMPYLDQGEFYSEFGSFDVKITLPENYVVAATGDLQEESEKAFLNQRMLVNDSTLLKQFDTSITSSTKMKSITFKQKNVHDFAWFASKYFIVEKSIAQLSNKRQVDCYSFFRAWNKKNYMGSSDITAKTISYLSEHVGEYPYQQASVVDGRLLAGGGMEYPNVTVIGSVSSKSELQTVIIHEVGHNWFYGLLGSNEREHPWMDEGINSFYEQQLDRLLSKDSSQKESNNKGINLTQKLNGSFMYQLAAKANEDQAIDLHSKDYTNLNYGAIVYKKTQSMFEYLQSYIGADEFERIMKIYYQQWHFKHPYPEDIKAIFESESKKDLNWFFEDALKTTKKIDFNITSVKKNQNQVFVYAKSRNDFRGPIPVSMLIGDRVISTQWIDYPYQNPAIFDEQAKSVQYQIDAEEILPEIKISNNHYATSIFNKINLKAKLGFGLGLSRKNDFFLLPALGYNYYDKMMLGLTIHNLRIPNNQFQFALAPMYSLGAKSFVGTGIVGYSMYPEKIFQKVTLGMSAQMFHHNESHLNIKESLYLRHIKWSPSIRMDMKKSSARATVSNHILLQYVGIQNQQFAYQQNPIDSLYRPSVKDALFFNVIKASYIHKNSRTFHPYSYRFNTEGNDAFLKLSLIANLRIDYSLKNKSFFVRVFAGKFYDFNTKKYALTPQYLAATSTAVNDYTYSETYLARNEQTGVLAQQISIRDGGFKVRTNQYATPVGLNNNWMTTVNMRSDIPIKLPFRLQLFADAGTYANAKKLNASGNNLLFDAGVEWHIIGDVFVIYAPLFMSKDFRDYSKSIYSQNRLFNNMTFSLNLSELNFLNTQGVTKILGF